MKDLNVESEKLILIKNIENWYNKMNEQLKLRPPSVEKQIEHLSLIRKDIYEDLNQIPHKAMIILVAEELQKEFPKINRWTWHPMQTSHPDFADLTGYINNEILLNIEVTTSLEPLGTIDGRMKTTLLSLNNKIGQRIYYVRTIKMLQRANTKIKTNGLKLEVRLI
jgi:hypothetical protein